MLGQRRVAADNYLTILHHEGGTQLLDGMRNTEGVHIRNTTSSVGSGTVPTVPIDPAPVS